MAEEKAGGLARFGWTESSSETSTFIRSLHTHSYTTTTRPRTTHERSAPHAADGRLVICNMVTSQPLHIATTLLSINLISRTNAAYVSGEKSKNAEKKKKEKKGGREKRKKEERGGGEEAERKIGRAHV